MSKRNPPPAELLELMHSLREGVVPPEQMQRLQQFLDQSPEHQDAFLDCIELHLYLKSRATSAEGVCADSSLVDPASPVPESGATGPTRLCWWGVGGVAAIAAALLVAVVPWWGDDPDGSPIQACARVVEMAGARFAVGTARPPSTSDPLDMGAEYVLTGGMVKLRHASGAESIMRAPAVFSCASANELRLNLGSCSVHAPPGAEGFVVLTPSSRVVDLGTHGSW